MQRTYSQKIIDAVHGCEQLLARNGIACEAFVLAYIVQQYLDCLRTFHEGRPLSRRSLRILDYPLIFYVLKMNEGNRVKTAQALGIARNTLLEMLRDAANSGKLVKLASRMGCENYLPKGKARYEEIIRDARMSACLA